MLLSLSEAVEPTGGYSILLCLKHGQCDARTTVTFPAYAGTHCAYPRRDGQAELIWVAGYTSTRSPILALTRFDVE